MPDIPTPQDRMPYSKTWVGMVGDVPVEHIGLNHKITKATVASDVGWV